MFHARQLFQRSSSGSVTAASASQAKAGDAGRPAERHPAMRGIDVSPVHGRHCICQRCERHSKVA